MKKLALACLLFAACSPAADSFSDGGNTMQTSQGLHMATPMFTLQPGEEVFKCYYTSLPNDAEVAITRFESHMSTGSHHYILYASDAPLRPDGTFEDCADAPGGSGADSWWLYASQTQENHIDMPAGVALPLKARQPLFFNMHYINASAQPISVHVEQDLTFAEGSFERAGAFISYNTKIDIPPMGTQTVSGHCAVPAGAKFFSMSTHSHKRTVMDQVARYAGGQMGELLVTTQDWEHPTVSLWSDPYFTFAAGEQLYYSCSYENSDDMTITTGGSAVYNEMCMAVGYFFPATANSRCLNSTGGL